MLETAPGRWSLRSPFLREGRADRALIALFVLINSLVLLNAILHEPRIGYDATQHLRYIQALAELRLPSPPDTDQFYSPPLPYLLPAAAVLAGGLESRTAGKLAQALNVLYSVVLTLFLLKICTLLRPHGSRMRFASLSLLGALPVYYRSFAFVRGDPLHATLWTVGAYLALVVFARERPGPGSVAALAVTLGLMVLTRQLAFSFFPPLVAFAAIRTMHAPGSWRRQVSIVLAVTGGAVLVGGWFYGHLYREFGSVSAYNRPLNPPSPASKSPLFDPQRDLASLTSEPLRPAFETQFLPTFYSDVWGDYHCYFLVRGWDPAERRHFAGYKLESRLTAAEWRGRLETNRPAMARYLGRVNVVSLIPTFVLLAGLAAATASALRWMIDPENGGAGTALVVFLVAGAAAGFLSFQVARGAGTFDPIKATYALHAFPMLAILGGDFLERLLAAYPRAGRVGIVLLGLSALHNVPALITRYSAWRFS